MAQTPDRASGPAPDRTPTPRDLDTISLQLNRPARDVVEIGARCVCGNPLVATTAPRLSNGIPFPTTFYLTHPVLTAAVSRLEAAGTMATMSERLTQDTELAARYRAAHEAYLAERERIGALAGTDGVPEIRGISAGGMPERVKCLHVLVGHSLAAGPGVNPLGDEALGLISEEWSADRCSCEGAWDPAAPVPERDLSRHVKRLAGEQNPIQQPAGADSPDSPDAPGRVVAAIDCGTNSIRLLVARVDSAGAGAPTLEDLHREMRVVRLGEGVDATGRLSEEAMARTLAAVEDYARTIREHGAESVRFVATSASRDAENAADFTAGIRQLLGVEPEVIPGSEEAALSFAGAASVLRTADADTGADTALEGPVLVVDLGGGSTEFVLGTVSDGRIEASRSMPLGCVRFTERHLHSDPPTAEEVSAATADLDAILDEVAAHVPLGRVAAVVGVAGTVTTVTAAALDLPEYDRDAIHGSALTAEVITATAQRLLTASRTERAALPYMHPGRVDVIGAGALIWSRIVERIGAETAGRVGTALTSEHDILDGIALSLSR